MGLPKFLQTYLPSYDISKMDLFNPEDKREIIEAVLNRGDLETIKWLGRTYSLKDIKKVIKSPRRGIWLEDVLHYWIKILNIKLPKLIYQIAIMSLKPRPKLTEKYFRYLERIGKLPKLSLKSRSKKISIKFNQKIIFSFSIYV